MICLIATNQFFYFYLGQVQSNLPDAISEAELVTQVALYTMLPFAVVFSFVFFLFYRQSRERQVRNQAMELELRALRAQMNPHFMFNCLNAIYQCIHEGKPDVAGNYILKFSFLTRRILENSFHRWITLEDDIEMLKAYLDLEQLRTDEKFSYEFKIEPSLDVSDLLVPMLLVQPFVENSIWHGFRQIDRKGHIIVSVTTNDHQLKYIIEDNGSNSVVGKENIEGKTSLGTSLVMEQLRAITKIENENAYLEAKDILNVQSEYCGKHVTVYLPLRTRF